MYCTYSLRSNSQLHFHIQKINSKSYVISKLRYDNWKIILSSKL